MLLWRPGFSEMCNVTIKMNFRGNLCKFLNWEQLDVVELMDFYPQCQGAAFLELPWVCCTSSPAAAGSQLGAWGCGLEGTACCLFLPQAVRWGGNEVGSSVENCHPGCR